MPPDEAPDGHLGASRSEVRTTSPGRPAVLDGAGHGRVRLGEKPAFPEQVIRKLTARGTTRGPTSTRVPGR